MHITERQQAWFNFSQGVALPDPGKYYGRGIYGAAVNGHLPLTKSVNVSDSKLEGVKVDSYELGWRFIGDNCGIKSRHITRFPIRAWKGIKIDHQCEGRQAPYLRRGSAVDYLIPDTDWSTGVNFNVLKTESKVNGQWQKI
ncbi:Ferric aerobactin receptor precursor [Escherichia coli]|nr:Ferric aerobactin receptor precursor [Escherichia coli]